MPLAIETVTDMKPEEARNHAKFTPTLNYTPTKKFTPTQRNTSALKATQHTKKSHQHNITKSPHFYRQSFQQQKWTTSIQHVCHL